MKKLNNESRRIEKNPLSPLHKMKVKKLARMIKNGKGLAKLWNSLPSGKIAAQVSETGLLNDRIAGIVDNPSFFDAL